MQFFNYNLPCPLEIPECEHLRNQYSSQLAQLKAKGGCGGCIERNFKNQFILRLQEIIKK